MADPGEHLRRLRCICTALPGVSERLSHGEPTFFASKKAFAMFSNHHHGDPRIAVWIPAPPGSQEALIHAWPEVFFKPPYVGVRGWVGIDLDHIGDDDLTAHITAAWNLIAPKKGRVGRAGNA